MITVGQRVLIAKTCITCGVLKQARDFARVMQFYYTSCCHTCKNISARPRTHKHQQKALKGAVRHRQPWTVEDIHTLSAMISEGLTGPQMALALNRSVYAVYTMKQKLKEQ